MLGIHFHHALGTAPVLPVFAKMVFRTLSGRLSAQCAATSFWCCVFTTFFFRDPWSMRGKSGKIFRVAVRQSLDLNVTLQAYVIVCFLVFKNLKNRIGVLVAVIQQLQVFENHWMSLWLKFESLERTLGQDTNNWHLQQKLKCLWVVLRVVGFLVDRSEEAVVKWCHLLRYSFRYFKSGRNVLKRVIIPQQQRSTWGGTGSATTAWQPELIRQIKRRNPKLSATLFN